MKLKFFDPQLAGTPIEMHKVRVVQKLRLLDPLSRLDAMREAGGNTFLLRNDDVFLDMLTDSGVNAMSDAQTAAMCVADDAYAGSKTFYKLEAKLIELFGLPIFLPAHQGRAAEHILAEYFIKPGKVAAMNYHFTTTKAHILRLGGEVREFTSPKGLEINNDEPFKGNMDILALASFIATDGDRLAFIRMEAGTNLIGGQPFSLQNAREVSRLAHENGIPLIMDASLLADNLHFIKTREAECQNMSVREITRALAELFDIIYFSARKLGCARGGGILLRDESVAAPMRAMVTLFEGFLTYGGMSVREMEAMAVGLEETMDEDMISQGPMFIEFLTGELIKRGVPVVTPAGGLGCHIDARAFLPHVCNEQFPSAALTAAIYLAGGIRGMERGTMSEERNPDGSEHPAKMELVRLAMPRRVFTMSQALFVADRLAWLHKNRELIGGMRFVFEPKELRFFFGRLEPVGDWQQALVDKLISDESAL